MLQLLLYLFTLYGWLISSTFQQNVCSNQVGANITGLLNSSNIDITTNVRQCTASICTGPMQNCSSSSSLQDMVLVFSEEFNQRRDFSLGKDRVWTSDYTMRGGGNAYTNLMYSRLSSGNPTCFNSSMYQFEDGVLKFQEDFLGQGNEVCPQYIRPLTYTYQNAQYKGSSLQSWQQFCFTGGYIEARLNLAQVTQGQELLHESGGNFVLALVGNLARMNYFASFDGQIGWSYDGCYQNTTLNQRITACPSYFQNRTQYGLNAEQGRGAPVIYLADIIFSQLQSNIRNQSQYSQISNAYAFPLKTTGEPIENKTTIDNTTQGKPFLSVTQFLSVQPKLTLGSQLPGIPQTSINPDQAWRTTLMQSQFINDRGTSIGDNYGTQTTFLANTSDDVNAFHNYGLLWEPGQRLRWYIDGIPVAEITEEEEASQLSIAIPQEPMYMWLGGIIDWNLSANPNQRSQFSGGVDYIRVYQPRDQINIGCSNNQYPSSEYIACTQSQYLIKANGVDETSLLRNTTCRASTRDTQGNLAEPVEVVYQDSQLNGNGQLQGINRLSKSQKAGVSVGIAIGILLIALVAAMFWCIFGRRSFFGSEGGKQIDSISMHQTMQLKKVLLEGIDIQGRGAIQGSTDSMKGGQEEDDVSLSDVMNQQNQHILEMFIQDSDKALKGISIIDIIGQGQSGVVYKARWFGELVAIKVITHNSSTNQDDVDNEIKLSMQLRHPNVVSTFHFVTQGGASKFRFQSLDQDHRNNVSQKLLGSGNNLTSQIQNSANSKQLSATQIEKQQQQQLQIYQQSIMDFHKQAQQAKEKNEQNNQDQKENEKQIDSIKPRFEGQSNSIPPSMLEPKQKDYMPRDIDVEQLNIDNQNQQQQPTYYPTDQNINEQNYNNWQQETPFQQNQRQQVEGDVMQNLNLNDNSKQLEDQFKQQNQDLRSKSGFYQANQNNQSQTNPTESRTLNMQRSGSQNNTGNPIFDVNSKAPPKSHFGNYLSNASQYILSNNSTNKKHAESNNAGDTQYNSLALRNNQSLNSTQNQQNDQSNNQNKQDAFTQKILPYMDYFKKLGTQQQDQKYQSAENSLNESNILKAQQPTFLENDSLNSNDFRLHVNPYRYNDDTQTQNQSSMSQFNNKDISQQNFENEQYQYLRNQIIQTFGSEHLTQKMSQRINSDSLADNSQRNEIKQQQLQQQKMEPRRSGSISNEVQVKVADLFQRFKNMGKPQSALNSINSEQQQQYGLNSQTDQSVNGAENIQKRNSDNSQHHNSATSNTSNTQNTQNNAQATDIFSQMLLNLPFQAKQSQQQPQINSVQSNQNQDQIINQQDDNQKFQGPQKVNVLQQDNQAWVDPKAQNSNQVNQKDKFQQMLSSFTQQPQKDNSPNLNVDQSNQQSQIQPKNLNGQVKQNDKFSQMLSSFAQPQSQDAKIYNVRGADNQIQEQPTNQNDQIAHNDQFQQTLSNINKSPQKQESPDTQFPQQGSQDYGQANSLNSQDEQTNKPQLTLSNFLQDPQNQQPQEHNQGQQSNNNGIQQDYLQRDTQNLVSQDAQQQPQDQNNYSQRGIQTPKGTPQQSPPNTTQHSLQNPKEQQPQLQHVNKFTQLLQNLTQSPQQEVKQQQQQQQTPKQTDKFSQMLQNLTQRSQQNQQDLQQSQPQQQGQQQQSKDKLSQIIHNLTQKPQQQSQLQYQNPLVQQDIQNQTLQYMQPQNQKINQQHYQYQQIQNQNQQTQAQQTPFVQSRGLPQPLDNQQQNQRQPQIQQYSFNQNQSQSQNQPQQQKEMQHNSQAVPNSQSKMDKFSNFLLQKQQQLEQKLTQGTNRTQSQESNNQQQQKSQDSQQQNFFDESQLFRQYDGNNKHQESFPSYLNQNPSFGLHTDNSQENESGNAQQQSQNNMYQQYRDMLQGKIPNNQQSNPEDVNSDQASNTKQPYIIPGLNFSSQINQHSPNESSDSISEEFQEGKQVDVRNFKMMGKTLSKIYEHSTQDTIQISHQSIKSSLQESFEKNNLGISRMAESTFLVQEFCTLGSLKDFRLQGRLHTNSVSKSSSNLKIPQRPIPNILLITGICVDIVRGMVYLQSQHVLHGDLKPENVLLQPKANDQKGFHSKLSDFGRSIQIHQDDKEAMGNVYNLGTVNYTAPEVLLEGKISDKSDVYSFGMLLWEMLENKIPYAGATPVEILRKVAIQNHRPKLNAKISLGLRILVEMCWDQEPKKRPPFTRIYKYLNLYYAKILEKQKMQDRNKLLKRNK